MHDHITGNTTFSKSIEILVAPDGTSRFETKGFTGDECRQASRFLEQALGKQTDEQLTAEFFGQQSVPSQQRQRQ